MYYLNSPVHTSPTTRKKDLEMKAAKEKRKLSKKQLQDKLYKHTNSPRTKQSPSPRTSAISSNYDFSEKSPNLVTSRSPKNLTTSSSYGVPPYRVKSKSPRTPTTPSSYGKSSFLVKPKNSTATRPSKSKSRKDDLKKMRSESQSPSALRYAKMKEAMQRRRAVPLYY